MSVLSVKKAFSILSMFSAAKTHLGITEIGRSLDLTNPTVHGLVKTLAEIGYLEQDPSYFPLNPGFLFSRNAAMPSF